MALIQLVYASRPFGFDTAILSGILVTARQHNPAHDITGALLCRADLYLQLLEGPQDAVTALYAGIARDDRHLEVTELLRRDITERMFPKWAMRDDPAHSLMWTQEEVAKGAVEAASPADIIAVFERLAASDPV
jgi:hypothetical protein